MPRYRDGFPRPKKEYHHGVWRIVWRWGNKKYTAATTIADEANIREIEMLVRDLASQLACDNRPVVSEVWRRAPGVMRYISDRFGEESTPRVQDAGKWLKAYESEITTECSSRWANDSLARLRKLDAAMGGFATITPESASKYLAGIAARKKAGTRNRALITFSRFFKWAIRTGQAKVNPFAGIPQLPEARRSDIVYCTPDERAEIIALARDTGWPDWMAVPVAFYSGMRREEVANVQWPDIRFGEGLIMVNKTKTGKSRLLPLNAKLEALLAAIPKSERTGYVVKMPEGFDRVWRMENLVRKIEKVKKSALLIAWNIPKPPPSRSKDYKEKRAAWEKEKAERNSEIENHLNRIGWNSFRHTFGSLLAQNGVSLDKISAWMGNTPEVCRRHYAQFIPRDRRDSEIDKL